MRFGDDEINFPAGSALAVKHTPNSVAAKYLSPPAQELLKHHHSPATTLASTRLLFLLSLFHRLMYRSKGLPESMVRRP